MFYMSVTQKIFYQSKSIRLFKSERPEKKPVIRIYKICIYIYNLKYKKKEDIKIRKGENIK